ncbi:hypothetical protein psyc5s11_04060 [Clostridium gelidum]|uniref:Uncharacterized protein n=1 Tax=Clostridium gelidum TaxID=704125 RepID=A0ABN6IV68_9CLOT|nr:hypothetical protein psyc5s11_04060 [Clostridium gelidum]
MSLEKPFKYLAKEQLQFYSENLRNSEGLFVDKKNISDGNSKGFSLVDKDGKFKFSDQAFMMDAYLLYSYYNEPDQISDEFIKFSYEILEMFKDYKAALYDLSFNENVQIFLSLNIFYKYSSNLDAKELILDLGDLLISKFQEKDYYLDSIDDCALFSICLMEAYKHTEMITFKEMAKDITEKLISLYDADKNIFIKLGDKKESKYSCLDVNAYLLSLIIYSNQENKVTELKPIISGIYRKFFVNGGLLTSWPEAPTLDEIERYKKLSLRSDDMLDETYFRMPILPTPKSTGLAPIFIKNLSYSKRKDSLSTNRTSFDSNKNMFNFFLIIYFLKDMVEDFMEFTPSLDSNLPLNSRSINKVKLNSDKGSINKNALSNVDNENPINLSTPNSSEFINKKINPITLTTEEYTNFEESEAKYINILKKTNNINLSTKNNISKANPSFKNKKYKKNKAQHLHNNKKV